MPSTYLLPHFNYERIPTYTPKRKYLSKRQLKKIILVLLIVGGIIIPSIVVTSTILFVDKKKVATTIKSTYQNLKDTYYQKIDPDPMSLHGFVPLLKNEINGPITIDRKNDDGTKLNLFKLLNNFKNDSFSYSDEDAFMQLPEVLPERSDYLCELNDTMTAEIQNGYHISCPPQYTITINYSFYGRYKNDTINCGLYPSGVEVPKKNRHVKETCGSEPLDYVKEQCEGKNECTLKPVTFYFGDPCKEKYKYLHVMYKCLKNPELKKPRIAIVNFNNKIKVNSIYENSVSEFYQYSRIHGYDYLLYTKRYDTERSIHFMKINCIIESIIKGLREEKYDWIFWADNNTILTNPNLKLETFLPPEDMNQIHFIAADDHNGLNAGVMFLRVHPWTLNMLMRAMSYFYYDNGKHLFYEEQASINNILTVFNESEHYIIVPQEWFNRYIKIKIDIENKQKTQEIIDSHRGGLLIHLAGKSNKSKSAKVIRQKILKNPKLYTFLTNEQMREQVMEYYKLPKQNQHDIKIHVN